MPPNKRMKLTSLSAAPAQMEAPPRAPAGKKDGRTGSRADVRSVPKRRSGIMKQVVVTLADQQEFVFDYGVLSVGKLAATLGG